MLLWFSPIRGELEQAAQVVQPEILYTLQYICFRKQEKLKDLCGFVVFYCKADLLWCINFTIAD